MPTPVLEANEGAEHVEWSETFHAFLFRARIYLKRFWWILIFTIAAGIFVQAWKKHNSIPQYRSDAEMMVNGIVSFGTSTAAEYNENRANYFETQKHLMMNGELEDAARADLLAQHPEYAAVVGNASGAADVVASTSIMHLYAVGTDPKCTKDFLEQWMKTFLERKQALKAQTIKEATININDKLIETDHKVASLRDETFKFRQDQLTDTVAGQIETAENKLRTFNEQIDEIQSKLRLLGWTRPPEPAPAPQENIAAPAPTPVAAPPGLADNGKALKETQKFKDYVDGKNIEQVDREVASANLLSGNADYLQNKAKHEQLTLERNRLIGNGLMDKHPKIVGLNNQIKDLNEYLRILRIQRVEKLEEQKTELLETLANAESDESVWNAKAVKNLQLKSQFDKLNDNLTMYQNIYMGLNQAATNLSQTPDTSSEMLRIYQHATDPFEIKESAIKQIGSGAFIGLAGGILVIFLLGALDGRVMSVEDLTQRFDEPMLGVIPMQKRTGGQVELLRNNDQRQMFAESCRNIRSSLLYMDRQGQRPRIIMLTSSMPSEGKSTLSANLAITLGFAASKTLLVDADMRRGQLHKRFNVKNDVGLAEHIKDGVPLKQVIQNTGFENLDFIPCGQYPDQPGELSMSERFEESIAALKEHYDFVIFDSPPILLTDDAASFATRADAVLFVVRAGYTRLRQVRTSLESLHRRGVNVYGMVVNFIDHREPGYYSYRYYDYYSYRSDTPGRKDRSA